MHTLTTELANTIQVRGLDHLGIAVRSLDEARVFYESTLGAVWEGIEEVAEQGVRVGFCRLGSEQAAPRIELLEPLDERSSLAGFLQKRGPGMHHVAYRVDDLAEALVALQAAGVRLIDAHPRRGAHGNWIAFIHPQSAGGVLTELCQRSDATSNSGR